MVLDLGSGEGLIPLMAARMNRRRRGWGVDIDAAFVDRSNERARAEGCADRVRFEHRKRYLHVRAAEGRIIDLATATVGDVHVGYRLGETLEDPEHPAHNGRATGQYNCARCH